MFCSTLLRLALELGSQLRVLRAAKTKKRSTACDDAFTAQSKQKVLYSKSSAALAG
jgi:hypothetical protein